MFEEQVGWAADAGVDFVIGETFSWTGEALVATEVIKDAGLPAVVTLTPHSDPDTRDGLGVADACRALEAAGADVVGLNCARGPDTMMPLLEEVRAAVSVHVAALPVPYRTHAAEPSMQSLRDPLAPGERAFPSGLDPFTCTRHEIARFTADALALGVDYLGVCCGAAPHHIRAMAEAIGRTPPASRYSADMSKHAYLGTDPTLKTEYQDYAQRL
jgi:betaine-homocysteine S-methyltransferase